MGCLRSATTARRPEAELPGAANDGRVMTRKLGSIDMPANNPTWTLERVELLKSHFAAGLSCREIADEIGVSRNAVIGKLSRLKLPRENSADAAPRPARRDTA